MNIPDLAKRLGYSTKKHSPAIFMGLSIAGVLATAYLTHKAAQKTVRTLDAPENIGVERDVKDTIKLVWKNYIPAALSCGASIGFIVAGNSIQFRRQAALVAALTLSDKAYSEYKDKMVEALGKNKEQKARDEISQDKVKKLEEDGEFDKLKLKPDTQEQYVYDEYSGRPFVSTVEKLNHAANIVARECINNDSASLNMFYREVGLPEIPMGEELGWNNAHPCEIHLSNAIVLDGKALIVINWVHKPKVDFENLWSS